MYKVKPSDIIPTRTYEQAFAEFEQGVTTSVSPDEAKLEKIWGQMQKQMNRGQSVNGIMRSAYRFIDEMTQSMADYSVCAKGCSHCCKLDVHISSLEAEYIEKNTEYSISFGNADREKYTNDVYCPFHDPETAQCQIYDFRPMACRWFFAYDDPQLCEDPLQMHAISTDKGSPSIPHLKNLRNNINRASQNKIYDVRVYFSEV